MASTTVKLSELYIASSLGSPEMLVECTVENTRLLGCMHAGNCYELASCMQSLWIWIYVHSAQCKQPRTHTTIASSNYRGEKGAQSYEGINIFILNSTVTHHIALTINRLSYTFVCPRKKPTPWFNASREEWWYHRIVSKQGRRQLCVCSLSRRTYGVSCLVNRSYCFVS